jgi:4-hydroxybenzoate polyprenyltransferase
MGRHANFLRAYTKACRIEFVPALGACMFILFFLGANSLNDLFQLHVIEAFAIVVLQFLSAFLINAVTDIDTDSKYKTFISDSVHLLGEKTIKKIVIIKIVIALILTLHLSYLFNTYWLFLWVLVGTFFSIGYSIKPFRFKIRGVFHATLMIAVFTMIILLYFVIAGMPTIPIMLIILSFITLHYGITLVDQTQDHLEDKESDLYTPSVRYGVTKTLQGALLLSIIGLALSFSGFYLLFNELSTLITFSFLLSLNIIFTIVTVILVMAYYIPLKGTWDLIKISLIDETIEEKMMMIKKRLNHPVWQLSGVVGVILISIIFFYIKTNIL